MTDPKNVSYPLEMHAAFHCYGCDSGPCIHVTKIDDDIDPSSIIYEIGCCYDTQIPSWEFVKKTRLLLRIAPITK